MHGVEWSQGRRLHLRGRADGPRARRADTHGAALCHAAPAGGEALGLPGKSCTTALALPPASTGRAHDYPLFSSTLIKPHLIKGRNTSCVPRLRSYYLFCTSFEVTLPLFRRGASACGWEWTSEIAGVVGIISVIWPGSQSYFPPPPPPPPPPRSIAVPSTTLARSLLHLLLRQL